MNPFHSHISLWATKYGLLPFLLTTFVFTVKLYFGWPLRGQFWTFAGYVNLSRSYVWETWGITPLSADKSFWGGLSCMLLKQVDVNQSAHLKFDNFDNEGQLLCVHHDMMVACLNWKKKSK